MAEFTAKDVQDLRRRTGAGMMDAKRALQENQGDAAAAARWLTEKGLAQVAKRSDRENVQGAVGLATSDSVAAMVELKCETDFVAASPEFVRLANELAQVAAAEGEDAVAKRQSDIESLAVTLKENIALGRIVRFEASDGSILDTYLHQQNNRGVNGVIVELEGGDRELAHDVALTIAFGKPQYLTRDEVPGNVVEEQRDVLEKKARNEGKPEAALPKIVDGMLTGYFKESVLLDQPFARDDKKSVQHALGDARVRRFAQITVG